MKYDYLIVGAGLYGATYAYCAVKKGKRCLVIDKRSHLGGNLYCKEVEGINVRLLGLSPDVTLFKLADCCEMEGIII